jgi:transposase
MLTGNLALSVFGVSQSSAIRWDRERRRTGSFEPKPQGGDVRSYRIESHADQILGVLEATPDITLAELRQALSRLGISASSTSLWRFFDRRGLTRKKRPATPSNRTGQTS